MVRKPEGFGWPYNVVSDPRYYTQHGLLGPQAILCHQISFFGQSGQVPRAQSLVLAASTRGVEDRLSGTLCTCTFQYSSVLSLLLCFVGTLKK